MAATLHLHVHFSSIISRFQNRSVYVQILITCRHKNCQVTQEEKIAGEFLR